MKIKDTDFLSSIDRSTRNFLFKQIFFRDKKGALLITLLEGSVPGKLQSVVTCSHVYKHLCDMEF